MSKKANLETKQKDGCAPLHFAVIKGPLEIVKILIDKGANIDATNVNNETPFYLAYKTNSKEISKYLLEKKRECPEENISNKAPCIICSEPRYALYVLNPCGHTSLCEICLFKIFEQNHVKCPTCRKPAQNYTRIFFQAPEEA